MCSVQRSRGEVPRLEIAWWGVRTQISEGFEGRLCFIRWVVAVEESMYQRKM